MSGIYVKAKIYDIHPTTVDGELFRANCALDDIETAVKMMCARGMRVKRQGCTEMESLHGLQREIHDMMDEYRQAAVRAHLIDCYKGDSDGSEEEE